MQKFYPALLAAVLLAACEEEPETLKPSDYSEPGAGNPDAKTPEGTGTTVQPSGRPYNGFDNKDLGAGRVQEPLGANRARLVPFEALGGEYTRVIGAAPASLAAASSSFDTAPARWFVEAQASGVGLSTMFSVSFEGAVAMTAADPKYAVAPTAETAPAECIALMKKAWLRTPSPEETSACVDLAVNRLGKEPDAKKKWAYVIASVLSTTRFATF